MYFLHRRNGDKWAVWVASWKSFGSKRNGISSCMECDHLKLSPNVYWQRWLSRSIGTFVNSMKRTESTKTRWFVSILFHCDPMSHKQVRTINIPSILYMSDDIIFCLFQRNVHRNGILLSIEIDSQSTNSWFFGFSTIWVASGWSRRGEKNFKWFQRTESV